MNKIKTNSMTPICLESVSNNEIYISFPPSKKELSAYLVNFIKSKFDAKDVNNKGFISFEKLNHLFVDLFPGFSPSILHHYLNEEMSNLKLNESSKCGHENIIHDCLFILLKLSRSSSRHNLHVFKGIDFKEFQSLYKKWYLPCMQTAIDASEDNANEDNFDIERV